MNKTTSECIKAKELSALSSKITPLRLYGYGYSRQFFAVQRRYLLRQCHKCIFKIYPAYNKFIMQTVNHYISLISYRMKILFNIIHKFMKNTIIKNHKMTLIMFSAIDELGPTIILTKMIIIVTILTKISKETL